MIGNLNMREWAATGYYSLSLLMSVLLSPHVQANTNNDKIMDKTRGVFEATVVGDEALHKFSSHM